MDPWVSLNSPMRRICLYITKEWIRLTAVKSGSLVICGSTGVSPGSNTASMSRTDAARADATLRRSSHNVAMRDIVLKHIIRLRSEYSEIPDSEFEPVRLEPAFDQAFGTWKGKYQGKRPGGIRRGAAAEKNSPRPNENSQLEKPGLGGDDGVGSALE